MCTDHSSDLHRPTVQIGRRRFFTGLGLASLGVAGVGVLGTVTSPTAAAAEVSQNGWPAAPDLAVNRNFAVNGITFPAGVAPGAPETILGYVATQFAATVEPLVNPGCWGFNYRPVTGGGSLSNHSSGTALDLNAPEHPYDASGTFTAGQVAAIRAILDMCEGTVRWGGDYTSTKDEMHFELNKAPGDASIARVAAKLGGSTPPPSRPTIREGDEGAAVTEAQQLLNAKGFACDVDGIFGPRTAQAVVGFQNANGLTADGIVGPNTWAALLA